MYIRHLWLFKADKKVTYEAETEKYEAILVFRSHEQVVEIVNEEFLNNQKEDSYSHPLKAHY